jgi:hypothetical protein
MDISQKIKNLPYDPTILLLGIYPKENKISTLKSIVPLLIITMNGTKLCAHPLMNG